MGPVKRGVRCNSSTADEGETQKQAEKAYYCFTDCKAVAPPGLLTPPHPSDSFDGKAA